MEIGVVVHGPNIIDSGFAIKIIDFLKDYGEVHARLGGTMGRTAVIDGSLEDIIDISNKLLPSQSLNLFNDENVDIIFLLNYGKSSVTGQVFGYKVFNHYLDKISNDSIPLIQIERPGEDDGSVILWNEGNKSINLNDFVNDIANYFKINVVSPDEIYENHFKREKSIQSERIIHGVSPNENILVNNIVIGKSNSDKVTLVAENGYIVDIVGGTIKNHGVEKLGKVDLDSVIVKTGLLRRSEVKPRIINNEKDSNVLKFSLLDHAGVDVYSYRDSDLVITIGDDTTLISSDILYRFNIPIIGITDGDLDKVVQKGFKNKDSVIFQVESGFDDIVGHLIYKEIFNNKNTLEYFNDNNLDNFKEDKINKLKSSIIELLNNIDCKYKITLNK